MSDEDGALSRLNLSRGSRDQNMKGVKRINTPKGMESLLLRKKGFDS